MFHPPLAAVGACVWMDAESKLEKKLGRKPTENEVRAQLGYPLVIGRTTNRYLDLGIMAGGTVSIPGTAYQISFAPARSGKGVEITLMEVVRGSPPLALSQPAGVRSA